MSTSSAQAPHTWESMHKYALTLLSLVASSAGALFGTLVALGLGSGVLAVAWLVYTIDFVLDEDRFFAHGSLDYHLLLPEIVQDAPAIAPVEPVEYYASAVAGAKDQREAILYRSSEGAELLRTELERYLLSRGYTRGPEHWVGPEGSVTYSVEDVGEVRIVLLERH